LSDYASEAKITFRNYSTSLSIALPPGIICAFVWGIPEHDRYRSAHSI